MFGLSQYLTPSPMVRYYGSIVTVPWFALLCFDGIISFAGCPGAQLLAGTGKRLRGLVFYVQIVYFCFCYRRQQSNNMATDNSIYQETLQMKLVGYWSTRDGNRSDAMGFLLCRNKIWQRTKAMAFLGLLENVSGSIKISDRVVVRLWWVLCMHRIDWWMQYYAGARNKFH